MLESSLILAAAIAVMAFILSGAVRRSARWRAMATPLASVIGSGFLVVAPLMALTLGPYAMVGMAVLILLAYMVGGIVRFNITHVEPILAEPAASERGQRQALVWMDDVGKLALALAYVTSIAFYLALLAAFVTRALGVEDPLWRHAMASTLLLGIGAVGKLRGLRVLEGLESYSVAIKLAVIAGLLIGLLYYNGQLIVGGQWSLPHQPQAFDLDTLRMLMGMLLVVQGFETSRYLRGEYPARLRTRTMRDAQIITGVIYVSFIALATVLFDRFHHVSETAIIDLSRLVSWILPPMLFLGAIMSQFSAAVADTIGAGGLIAEGLNGRLSQKTGYLLVALSGVALIWLTPVFSIISYASRAFAAYYAIQGLQALLYTWRAPHGQRRVWHSLYFGFMTMLLVSIALFARLAESGS